MTMSLTRRRQMRDLVVRRPEVEVTEEILLRRASATTRPMIRPQAMDREEAMEAIAKVQGEDLTACRLMC